MTKICYLYQNDLQQVPSKTVSQNFDIWIQRFFIDHWIYSEWAKSWKSQKLCLMIHNFKMKTYIKMGGVVAERISRRSFTAISQPATVRVPARAKLHFTCGEVSGSSPVRGGFLRALRFPPPSEKPQVNTPTSEPTRRVSYQHCCLSNRCKIKK